MSQPILSVEAVPMNNGLTNGQRRCEVCRTKVCNQNLGGHNGKSALSGPLFCERCSDEPIERRNKRTRSHRCDSFERHCEGIIDEIRTLILAVTHVSLEPASRAAHARLTVAGREVKRRCNRLAYDLRRKAWHS